MKSGENEQMPLDETTRKLISEYVEKTLPTDKWYDETFDFIDNEDLRLRLKIEFSNVRKIYKLFEAIKAEGDMLEAEIRVQILMYASIYEAVIHYLLFDKFESDLEVQNILYHTIPKKYSISKISLEKLKKELIHDGKEIVPMYYDRCKKDITSIRFDDKCKAAHKMGIITSTLKDELIKIYELRNCLHIHAELRKGVDYDLEMSRTAYRRMKLFISQVKEYCDKEK